MDIDMHYYGTYALARAAGLRADVSRRIAMSAEFVDDSTDDQVIVNPNGARFRGEATAHHPFDLPPNNDRDDQLTVWLPFHFLPACIGDNQSQRLVCRKDSDVAKEMVAHHLQMADRVYAPELIGITAHVYADTFAHYGFSGVSSRLNRVDGNSIKLINGDISMLTRFMGKFGIQGGLLKNFRQAAIDAATIAAEDATGALGHGPVATYPDQPFLQWSYSYERTDLVGPDYKVVRNNANDYMDGAKALHAMFRKFAASDEMYTDKKGGLDFEKIEPTVRGILETIADTNGRIALWRKALDEQQFTNGADAALPDYSHDEWRTQTDKLGLYDDPQKASGVPVYQFYQAAAMHKYYVLRELLPSHGVCVV